MSIHKKLLSFTCIIVSFSTLLLLTLTWTIQRRQIHQDAQHYLSNAFAIAYNIKDDRLEQIRIAGELLAQNPEFSRGMGSEHYLDEVLANLHRTLPYIDYVAILEPRTLELFAASKGIVGIPAVIKEMIQKATPDSQAVTGEFLVELEELFAPDSPELERYQVRMKEEGGFLRKCLTGASVTPVYTNGELTAYLVVADIANNDDSMPEKFSGSLKNAYFSLSIDGIRVCSNVRDESGADYIGSDSPVVANQWAGVSEFTFGRVKIGNEYHVFLTGYITDYMGKQIATLGVGMPEKRFYSIMGSNSLMIVLVGVVTLLFMLLASFFVTRRITAPINLSTEIAQRIAKGEREFTVDPALMVGEQETARLLRALNEMALSLDKMEKKISEFLQELLAVNDQLEERIAQRTSELRQIIGELRRSNEVKSQFLANMTHELRTPLNAVICSGEALLEGHFGPLPEKHAKYIENITSSGRHLLQIINDILDISKIDAGMMKLSFESFYFVEALDSSLSAMHAIAESKGIQIHKVYQADPGIIYADKRKVRQILYNILSNAIKFTPQGGTVWIDARRSEGKLWVSIKDNGIGIKKDDQARIFEAFEQADSSYGREYEGTGLGLPLCRYLVEMHGGEIMLSSQEGTGTEVVFTLVLRQG